MAYMNTGIFVGCFLLLKGVYYYWYGGRGSNQISNQFEKKEKKKEQYAMKMELISTHTHAATHTYMYTMQVSPQSYNIT